MRIPAVFTAERYSFKRRACYGGIAITTLPLFGFIASVAPATQASGAPIPEKVTQIALASQVKNRKESPQIDFVPPALNTDSPIIGKVTGAATPTDYKVVLLLSRDQKIWWDKTHNVHGITIQPDGTFTVKGWANVPRTLTTPYMGVWLVPQSFDLHAPNFQVEGAALPENLTRAAVAVKIKIREASEPDKLNLEASKPPPTVQIVA